LEDRIVKNIFNSVIKNPIQELKIPSEQQWKSDFTLITKKPLKSKVTEVLFNHRSRSAKLRCIERNE
jgi:16S rRNA C1402 N4-methylase RsmH